MCFKNSRADKDPSQSPSQSFLSFPEKWKYAENESQKKRGDLVQRNDQEKGDHNLQQERGMIQMKMDEDRFAKDRDHAARQWKDQHNKPEILIRSYVVFDFHSIDKFS